MNNKKTILWVAVIIIVIVVLFAWPKLFDPNKALVADWNKAGIGCLPSHQNAALHIHQAVSITVDGSPKTIPASTGVVRRCMAELHTHDATGEIHAESIDAQKEFTLGQFFVVWGKTIAREGYNLEVKINDVVTERPESTVLTNKQKIEMTYTKK